MDSAQRESLRGRLRLAAKLMDDPNVEREFDKIVALEYEVLEDKVLVWTKPERKHEVRTGADGVVYCMCPDWKFRNKKNAGTCKHVMRLSLDRVAVPNQRVTYP